MGIWSKEYHEGYQQGYKDAKEEFKNTMRKYQKIEQIVRETSNDDWIGRKIKKVLEDGNDEQRGNT